MINQLLRNRYRIIKQLAFGSQSSVFLARDELVMGRNRVVKIYASTNPQSLLGIENEIRLLSSLYHPTLPIILDYEINKLESIYYIVMDWIEGTRLDQLHPIKNYYERNELAIHALEQLLSIFLYLHEHPSGEIIYMDLKPDNLLVDSRNQFHLIDFGISIHQKGSDVLQLGNTHRAFLPPENRLNIDFTPTVQNDLFALGVIVYYLLSENKDDKLLDLNKSNWGYGVPTCVLQIILKLVESDSKYRYKNARDAHSDLMKIMKNEKIG